MAQWFEQDDRPETRRARDDRNWLERGRDEVRSWVREDREDEEDDDRVRYGRPVDDSRIGVSGTRPEWLDRGRPQSQPHTQPQPRPQPQAQPRSEGQRTGSDAPPFARHHAGSHHTPPQRDPSTPSSAFWLVPGPHVGRGPNGYRRSDERILEDVCERLMQHGWIDARHVDVIVSKGEVTLRGTVENKEMKRAAEDVADSVFGVVDVRNELKAVPAVKNVEGAQHQQAADPQPNC
jgi:hypothetical protein